MAGTHSRDASGGRSRRAQQDRRNPRLRLACLRCQRRKIRCDGELPACKNCRSAGAECSDGESTRLPTAYIDGLKRRIRWLESIVSVRCPDVDLAQGPSPPDGGQGEGDDEANNINRRTQGTLQSPEAPQRDTATSEPAEDVAQVAVRSGPGQASGANALSHEIGLVSLGTGQDPRYIGPSSGYFLARVMLISAPKDKEMATRPGRDLPFPTQLVEAVQGPLPLPPRELAKQLCDAYFEVIHPQYPILHQNTFMATLDHVYFQESHDPIKRFHVYMVLAIGATILSGRLKARVPGESYCLSALRDFNELNVENSLQGLQCLLLLLIFTTHSPYMRLNVWYLNYHCLAALLDLGLQRNISTPSSGISFMEQEMRARIFWVILTMDRTIATMMGRPIGIRDEACELRMPQGLSDNELAFANYAEMTGPVGLGQMAFAMHLFEATKLNSEIKYVANSINRKAPSWAYPSIINVNDWQATVLQRINQWGDDIPPASNDPNHQSLRLTCQLRYHGLRMLLLRPSPAIPKPPPQALTICYESACESIQIFDELYRRNLLVHSWMSFHSLVLSTITMLYCIKAVPDIAQRIKLDVLMRNMSIALSVLSATGEHWSGAKRSRDILDQLGRSTIQWLQEIHDQGRVPAQAFQAERLRAEQPRMANGVSLFDDTATLLGGNLTQTNNGNALGTESALNMTDVTRSPFDDFLHNGSFSGYFDDMEPNNVDEIVRDLFQDFIPITPIF